MPRKSFSPKNKVRILNLSIFLRELRINSGYTQAEVAKEINLSRNSISAIERQGLFRIQHLYLLADFYEIPINKLFEDIQYKSRSI